MEFKIIDLEEKYIPEYCVCLEDWDDSKKAPGELRREWYETMRDKGVRGKLAINSEGVVGGMIEYMPIEYSFAEGSDLYFITCIWVHGHEAGRGDFQGEGMGTELLKAAEEDVKNMGIKGLVAWGISAPFWMKAAWYEKHGYKEVDREGWNVLLLKKFQNDVKHPRWIRGQYEQELIPGKVKVTSFVNGQCMAENDMHLKAKRVAAEFGNKVVFEVVRTLDKGVMRRFGIKSGLYINGKDVFTGAPLTQDEIRQIIKEEIEKI